MKLDDQLYEHKRRAGYDPHDDDEWDVCLTAKQWREIENALAALEARAQPATFTEEQIERAARKFHDTLFVGELSNEDIPGWMHAFEVALSTLPAQPVRVTVEEVEALKDRVFLLSAELGYAPDAVEAGIGKDILRVVLEAKPSRFTPPDAKTARERRRAAEARGWRALHPEGSPR